MPFFAFSRFEPGFLASLPNVSHKCLFLNSFQQLVQFCSLFIIIYYYLLFFITIYYLFICRCAPRQSSYAICNEMISSLNDTSSLPLIPNHELLKRHTLVGEGFTLWHCIIIQVAAILVLNILVYVTLRFVRKPKLAQKAHSLIYQKLGINISR